MSTPDSKCAEGAGNYGTMLVQKGIVSTPDSKCAESTRNHGRIVVSNILTGRSFME